MQKTRGSGPRGSAVCWMLPPSRVMGVVVCAGGGGASAHVGYPHLEVSMWPSDRSELYASQKPGDCSTKMVKCCLSAAG